MTRKGYLLATASGVAAAASAGNAQAADLAARVAPAVAPPAASWAGWYIGLNAGANWQHASNSTAVDGGKGASSTAATGFIGGGQIGYNWQDGNFVFGLEADIAGLTGTGSTIPGSAGGANLKGSFSNRIRWLNTDRVRMGLAVGNTMAYVTGGLAVGGVKNSFTAPTGCAAAACVKSQSKTRAGWAFGGGIEHILWNSQWTVGLEGLFVDLGQSTIASPVAGSTKTTRFSNQAGIGRLKLNYKW